MHRKLGAIIKDKLFATALQVALSPVLPGALQRALFWARVGPLVLLTLWADYAAWVPSADDRPPVGEAGPARSRRHLQRNLVRVR